MTDVEKQELVDTIAGAISCPPGSILLVTIPTQDRIRNIMGTLSQVRVRTGCEFMVTTPEFRVEQLGVTAPPMEVVDAMVALLRAGVEPADVARASCDPYLILTREPRFVLVGETNLC
jgi:hypothetical protein